MYYEVNVKFSYKYSENGRYTHSDLNNICQRNNHLRWGVPDGYRYNDFDPAARQQIRDKWTAVYRRRYYNIVTQWEEKLRNELAELREECELELAAEVMGKAYVPQLEEEVA